MLYHQDFAAQYAAQRRADLIRKAGHARDARLARPARRRGLRLPFRRPAALNTLPTTLPTTQPATSTASLHAATG